VFSLLVVSRNTLLLFLCGAAILYVMHKAMTRGIKTRVLFRSGALLGLGVFALFTMFSFLRGTSNWDDQINSFLGYTIASYNRLAALVNGQLRYPYGGHGVYLSNVATHSRLLPFNAILMPPEYLEVWASEFGAVSGAGLDGNLIWSGAFGYIFSDLGWFAIPFLLLYGLLYGAVWTWMKRGAVAGIVLYPCFGFCILFWIGSNYLLDAPLEVLIVVTGFFVVYESVFLKTAYSLHSETNSSAND
jgi:hypothetical protein